MNYTPSLLNQDHDQDAPCNEEEEIQERDWDVYNDEKGGDL
ncbi:MAG: hypothetical protein PF440_00275 [Thiomicrorhabdus sp.]|jgi:hypothetical protein|nr:hypothetical protein [Thiomicrorhabdus sp.]